MPNKQTDLARIKTSQVKAEAEVRAEEEEEELEVKAETMYPQ